ncbi:transposase [Chryseobacterium lathyri]|uniref:transposase n=1 Tax=Chryseobacterium lathyri TaxID=395933 RepID=UPI001CBC0DBA
MTDFKNIHIGSLIKHLIEGREIETDRVCKFIKCTDEELAVILSREFLGSDLILRFSILLEYDFFRIYSQYLILYAPPSKLSSTISDKKVSLPQFKKKSLYTKEIIDFILELISSGKKTKRQVIEEYKIPKTTLYKWISKYHNGF